ELGSVRLEPPHPSKLPPRNLARTRIRPPARSLGRTRTPFQDGLLGRDAMSIPADKSALEAAAAVCSGEPGAEPGGDWVERHEADGPWRADRAGPARGSSPTAGQ